METKEIIIDRSFFKFSSFKVGYWVVVEESDSHYYNSLKTAQIYREKSGKEWHSVFFPKCSDCYSNTYRKLRLATQEEIQYSINKYDWSKVKEKLSENK